MADSIPENAHGVRIAGREMEVHVQRPPKRGPFPGDKNGKVESNDSKTSRGGRCGARKQTLFCRWRPVDVRKEGTPCQGSNSDQGGAP